MIEKTMEVFMDDFSVFGDSFSSCLSHLDKMLQRCEDTNLVLNWEKCTLWMLSQDCSGGFCCSKNLMSLSVIKKGAENLAADHLSRLENPHQSELEKKEIRKHFLSRSRGRLPFVGDDNAPMVCRILPTTMREFCDQRDVVNRKGKFSKTSNHYFWDDPFDSRSVQTK
ncbi:hypothetical protein Tco_0173380 [Tanacetum coccineum]